MRRSITFRFAAYALLVLFSVALLFQFTVLFGLVPLEMVWGGRLQDEEERTVGAIVSIGVLLLAMIMVLMRMGLWVKGVSAIGRWGMWVIMVIFLLNTLGNLFALDLREKLIFTPVTLIAALLAWRVAIGPEPRATTVP